MAGLTIHCPQCDAPLKLPDRSLLGKTGKCPKCAQRFVLQEQQEVEIELVQPAQTTVGKNAHWIPDTPAKPTANAAAEANPLASLFQESPAETNTENDPLAFLQAAAAVTPPPTSVTAFDSVSAVDSVSVAHSAAAAFTGTSVATPVGSQRRKKRRSAGNGLMIGIAFLLFGCVGAFVYLQSTGNSQPVLTITENVGKATTGNQPTPVNSEKIPTRKIEQYNVVKAQSPTAGEPIQLYHLPAGVRLVINLHPAQIWSDDRKFAEFRASLGPLGPWLESQIRELSQTPPAEIDEMLIGIILGPRGTVPEVATVIHFAQPQQRADLLQKYSGDPYEEFSTELRVNERQAIHLIDEQTVAICPKTYVEDLKIFSQAPAMTGDNIQEILKATDRDRLLTIAFDPTDIEQHIEGLFPAGAELTVSQGLRWLGEDIWSAAWSIHYEEDFYTEMIVRGQNHVGTTSLSQLYQKRLNQLAEMILVAVQKMNPQRSGYRKIIGRFPAMMKVLALTTTVGIDGRYIRLGTKLPAKAAPNLALGTLLTWDESTRTDFTAQTVTSGGNTAKADPAKLPLSERLKRTFPVDFRRTPLQEAFAYIASESKIPIEIDGDALKLAGFTKNMPQTFQLDSANALQAIYGIVKTYEKEEIGIAIHIDEAANLITVLTTKVAADRQLKTYDFKANGIQ